MLGGALTISHERKINTQTPNDASTYCRGRGICCPRDTRFRAQSTIDNPNWGPCRRVSVHDKPVRVTCKEYWIFELLSVRKGAIVTRQTLLDHLYDGTDRRSSRSSMFLSAIYAKSSPRQPAAIITSKRCGAAVICFATGQQKGPPGHVREDAGGLLRDDSYRDRPVHAVKPRLG
jgi:hypothetical protein